MNIRKPHRRLALSRETIRELQRDELQRVAAGALVTAAQGCVESLIPTCGCTGYYPSLNAPCTN